MDSEDQELEALLRQFQPRAPAPLPDEMPSPRVWTRRLMPIAAALALSVGLWQLGREMSNVHRRPPPAPPAAGPIELPLDTLGGLGAALMTGPERLDLVLAETSRRLLPDVEASDGALQILGRPEDQGVVR